LKVKYSDFVLITRSATLPKSTDDGPRIYATVCRLLEKTQVGRRPLRLLGIALSQLATDDSEMQLSLFNPDREDRKEKGLHGAIDAVHEKFGDRGLRPGTLIEKRKTRPGLSKSK